MRSSHAQYSYCVLHSSCFSPTALACAVAAADAPFPNVVGGPPAPLAAAAGGVGPVEQGCPVSGGGGGGAVGGAGEAADTGMDGTGSCGGPGGPGGAGAGPVGGGCFMRPPPEHCLGGGPDRTFATGIAGSGSKPGGGGGGGGTIGCPATPITCGTCSLARGAAALALLVPALGAGCLAITSGAGFCFLATAMVCVFVLVAPGSSSHSTP
mmetsp:Transcript_6136/g.10632  ORF Transcript_6136/g.10632 Transcript_6136/m.10632 type:complete len:210 (+) Transcript_6136:89-718(+)